MLTIRRSHERGFTKTPWLESYHTFSFNDYFNPQFHHFHTLRVINDDIVAPNTGFNPHSHKDMEIITYVTRGAVTHRDSMGNEAVIRAGEIQRMRAGTGVTHSEHNLSKDEPLELLQIWLFPREKNLTPDYAQMAFDQNYPQFRLLVSPDGKDNSLSIEQDCHLWMGLFNANQTEKFTIKNNHAVWIQLVKGELQIGNEILKAGDGAGIEDEREISLTAKTDTEFLLFDLGS